MTPTDPSTIPEDELHAFVDGRLSPEAHAALQARIVGDEQAAATVQAWKAQRDELRRLHRGLLDEPAPAAMARAAEQAGDLRVRGDQWWRWGGMAAGVVLTFAAGWFASNQWRAAIGLAMAPASSFVRQAAAAHLVYLPEVRHPVEVPAAQQDHLVQWLSKRLGRPLKVPQLGPLGYELVGGRLLPGEEGARAQFMFQNAAGERVTLYVGAIKGGSTASKETSFRFTTEGPVPGFYWVDQGFGYALAGQLPREALMNLAHAVYGQL